MKSKLSDLLIRMSPLWVFIISLAIFIIFLAIILPQQAQIAKSYAGEVGSPDTTFFYSRNDLLYMAEVFGENGREAYIRSRYTFDLIFPLTYTFFLVTGLSWLSQQIMHSLNKWRALNLVPIVGMLFDFLENISVSIIFAEYPGKSVILSSAAPFISLIKWVFVLTSFLILIIFFVTYLLKKRNITSNISKY